MKRKLRYILDAILLAILVGGMGVMVYFSSRSNERIDCADIKVEFEDGYRFLNDSLVENIIIYGYGMFKGMDLNDIALHKIEKTLCSTPCVQNAEAWVENDALLHVRVKHKVPVLKLVSDDSDPIYVDEYGFSFPSRPGYEIEVPVIHGKLKADRNWIEQSLELVKGIKNSSILSKRISVIYSIGHSEMLLIDNISGERLLLGEASDIPSKLSRLESYYSSIVPTREEGYYKWVSVKYKGQIICKQ